MSKIDQFESFFKAADKPRFTLQDVSIDHLLVITDVEGEAADRYVNHVRTFLSAALPEPEVDVVRRADFVEIATLLEFIADRGPDLICTYRNLHSTARTFPYSLGSWLDVMTQATRVPVMVLPHPRQLSSEGRELSPARKVMAITDHLAGEHRLVSYAAALTPSGGQLYLSHVEDEAVFLRYVEAIGKIPEIDTDTARQQILQQLLKDPHDYIQSCRQVLQAARDSIAVEELVQVGHHLNDYQQIVSDHAVDLLVMNTKDEDQTAMHGLAYPLTVELRDTALLLL